MTVVITPAEIDQFRQELADIVPALVALDMIEACEGDVEDAAISLAIRIGQEPDTSERWLEGVAKRWRPVMCQPHTLALSPLEQVTAIVETLTTQTDIPPALVAPVAIFVFKTGLSQFCQPLSAKLI
jgi:hypothetical protein